MTRAVAVDPQATADLPFRRRLQLRLILSFVILATVPLLVVLWFALAQMRLQTQRQVINQLTSIVELKRDQIERWFQTNALVIEGFLASPGRHAELSAFVADATPDPEQQQRLNSQLSRMLTLHPGTATAYFHSLYVYNHDGHVLAASDPTMIGRVVVRQPYYAVSLQGPAVSKPFYAVGSGQLTMVMSRPLIDDTLKVVGVLAGELDLESLGKIMLERTGLGNSGETYLVSKENNYLLTPSRFADYIQTRAYHSEGIDQGLAGKNGGGRYMNYHSPPAPVIGVYRWMPSLDAALIAEIDEREAQALFTQTTRLSVAMALVAALAAVLIGLLVASHIARPMRALAEVASNITAGALNQRSTINRSDEIGVLSNAFNRMTDRLQESLEGLEQRVAERTADLQQANAEAQRALAELQESLRQRDALTATVRQLSSPVLPVLRDILVMPLVGEIDSERADALTSALLSAIEQHRAKAVIIDVTGVPVIDSQVAQALVNAANAARLLGTRPILVGLRPELAQTIVGLGLGLHVFTTQADLQSGIAYAMSRANGSLS